MVELSHGQKRHRDAGGLRLWSLRGKHDLSVRTVERIMALNRRVSPDMPGTAALDAPPAVPPPHPCTATAAHADGFIDGRMRDFAIEGHRWWSRILLDGYARTMLAGAGALSEASWVALTVLSTACQREGVPVQVMSDSGGAFLSDALEGVCTRLGMDPQTLVSTEGQSSMNLMETPCNIQRRWSDSQCSLTQTPLACEAAHQHLLALSNTTAHQGLRTERLASPIPLHGLGEAQGRLYPPQELERQFACALCPRTTKRSGCVTVHREHFEVEQGLPQTQGLLGVSGHELRAVFDPVVWAAYHGHDDVRSGTVTDIRDGSCAPTRFASPQGALLPFNPQDCGVVYRPQARSHRPAWPCPAQPLWLFAGGKTA
jgi:hypothetical protein